jgi:hypothetical protein
MSGSTARRHRLEHDALVGVDPPASTGWSRWSWSRMDWVPVPDPAPTAGCVETS